MDIGALYDCDFDALIFGAVITFVIVYVSTFSVLKSLIITGISMMSIGLFVCIFIASSHRRQMSAVNRAIIGAVIFALGYYMSCCGYVM